MEQTADIRILNEKIEKESSFVDIIRMEMNKVIIGQRHLTDSLLIGLLASGHILLEGVPGLAKTLAIKSLASIIDALQQDQLPIFFQPTYQDDDLSQKKEFYIRKVLSLLFILADEINRSPAKVQSALLEAMQERQVTIGQTTHRLDEPFLVLATQNPIEQEGTYPLPEAQVDRFMMKVVISYPSMEEEKLIVRENLAKDFPAANTVLNTDDIIRARNVVREVYMDEKIENYILNIVFASRNPEKFGPLHLRT
jgi:MoxR-like ATPase